MWVALAAISAGLVSAEAAARIAPKAEVLIIARALAYDRNLQGRVGDHFVLSVITRAGDPTSLEEGARMYEAFKAIDGVKIQGISMHVREHAYENRARLAAHIGEADVDVLYICGGMGGELSTVKQLTREFKVTSIGARPSYVRGGLAVGAFADGERTRLIVNLTAAEAEGASFAATLLRLAEVIR